RASLRLVATLGVAVFATSLERGMNELAFQVVFHNHYDANPAVWWQSLVAVSAQLLAVLVIGLLGGFLRRRLRPPGMPRPVLDALATVVPIGVAVWLVSLASRAEMFANGGHPFEPQALAAIAAWTAAMVATVAISRRLAGAGRRALAWSAGFVGALVAA